MEPEDIFPQLQFYYILRMLKTMSTMKNTFSSKYEPVTIFLLLSMYFAICICFFLKTLSHLRSEMGNIQNLTMFPLLHICRMTWIHNMRSILKCWVQMLYFSRLLRLKCFKSTGTLFMYCQFLRLYKMLTTECLYHKYS